MNRDQIKFLAIITMTCNHIANIFLTPGTLLFEIMIDIGYFTAITMCYFLVEGYGYTHDKKKYGERLLLFGVISFIPFCLAFGMVQMNMLCTLFLCFLILKVMEMSTWKMGKMDCNINFNLCIPVFRLGITGSCFYNFICKK